LLFVQERNRTIEKSTDCGTTDGYPLGRGKQNFNQIRDESIFLIAAERIADLHSVTLTKSTLPVWHYCWPIVLPHVNAVNARVITGIISIQLYLYLS
jgi:hypothetical protein